MNEVLQAISPDNVRRYVEHVASHIPSRLAGSENGRRMAEYNALALSQAGVEAAVQETLALVSFPEAGEFEVISPRRETVSCFTCAHSLQTPEDGLTGPLVFAGAGSAEDFERLDVAGKIALCENSYAPARMEKQRLAALRGAAGIVFMNWGHPDSDTLPLGSVKSAWGNPTPETWRDEMPKMPAIGISRASGIALQEQCRAGPVDVRIKTAVENCWRPVQITVGELMPPGRDDFVLLGGHQDSWFGEAATDNAAGNGCIIELARIFAGRRDQLRRGLVFGFWTAHETGTMVGSSWFADQNWDRLRRNAVAYVSIDQPGCVGTSRWLTKSNLEMRRFHQRIERELLSMPIDWKPQNKGGDASFFGLGIPMIYGMASFSADQLRDTANANLGWWHHSTECTVDKVDFGTMGDHLRVYASWLWELCTAPILPFEFKPVAGQFLERLQELDRSPGASDLGLTALVQIAAQFQSAAHDLDETVCRLRQVPETTPGFERSAGILNTCLKRLSNRLIPVQSTVKGVYGHDPYGYTPQHSVIPCLHDVPRYASLPVGSHERILMHTQLVRERNRVADALNDSRELIEDALSRVA
ncbi:M28 family peptidase [Faunimonas sp. B44]|uniref:M28 family peptidase n=1 Tax=Faunimonas sp. B44 TaxID=3461493 RepID=UPI0040439DF3